MMKNTKKLMAFMLSLSMICAAGCSNSSNDDSDATNTTTSAADDKGGEVDANAKECTITFKNGEDVVQEVTAKAGETVDLPADLTSEDSRMIFKGWEGVSEADIAAGNVQVFDNATYNAIWYESFGTEQEFKATKLAVTDTIAIDGEMDAAWEKAEAIPVSTVTAGETDTNGTVRFMWDSQYLYIYAEVTDSTHYGYAEGAWTEHNDCFETWIDLLHNDDSHGAAGFSGGWGGDYRGEPGPMCEAHYKINAGSEFNVDSRFGAGSEACWDGWLSNETNNDGVSYGTTKLTDTGYTVEYRIKADHENVPEELRLHADQVIGIGVKLYDKMADDGTQSIVCMEAVNDAMSNGPKKLSNVRLVSDEDDSSAIEAFAKQVRDGYDVTVDNAKDVIYKDAADLVLGESVVKFLWNNDTIYALAEMGENTEYININDLKFEKNGTIEGAIKVSEALSADTIQNLSISYKDGGDEVVSDCVLKIQSNESNIGRNTYEIHKLNGTITVDGDKDDAYGDAATVEITTITAEENGGSPAATGKAWVMWDDEYLYAFVDVVDANVSTEQKGDPWQNDSVELWLSTCRSLPTSTTHWGDANRPEGRTDYCGEGGFRVLANNIGDVTGQHWMYDWADGVPREMTSKLTDTGYTVEYKIHFSAFAGEEKLGEVIDIMFNINDDNGDGAREGIVSTNTQGSAAYDLPFVLDHFKLVD